MSAGRENGHRAIVGVTRSGKTTLAQVLAAGLHSRGRFVGVFDPKSPAKQWRCNLFTRNPLLLLQWAQTHSSRGEGRPIYLFWDEWGPYIGSRTKDARPFAWLGTSSRHQGITNFFLAHGWRDLDAGLRENVDVVYAFTSGHRSAALLAEDFLDLDLSDVLPRMPRLSFKELTRFAETRCGQISFSRGGVRVKLTTPTKVVRV